MGICASCEAGATLTAKVILSNGDLREYSRPVKAAQVLGKEVSAWFVCDADVMDFDGFVSAVKDEEELRPGQLYFVLPASMLRKPLLAEQIAAMAAKASAALVQASKSKSWFRRRSALVFAEPVITAPVRSKRSSNGRRVNFATSLSVIKE